ncbi:hypothetical protein ACOMICROBIO_FLGHMIGD_01763 [Vibrio sp. B1FLJ16]|uniref:hypothetical protein n=1 Tax=Vibrio sp. B1FLJ16 TaxID=2751178 RepID=UPI0015F4306A|nr:hypothetical protein [Vibrio sp. B1FLJ16]CAD7808002.1 hypothetical protein ACOMICROBIO_FLGHMIGD_01763 [Vibrio sp. B1FLJ16]CAE6906000.1 hypothetical protein ACOMICROBIO_FLGHMIGD_01763 [Vibrio sp. B1FLJ16]
MDFSTKSVRLIAKMDLSQKRYKNGELLFCLIEEEDGSIIGYDIRYFYLDNDNIRKASRSGFRVPLEKLKLFIKTLSLDFCELVDICLWDKGNKKFHVRYSESYGGGIDFRRYVDSEKYVGWEKSGIRISEKDWPLFLRKLKMLDNIQQPKFYELLSQSKKQDHGDSGNRHVAHDILLLLKD